MERTSEGSLLSLLRKQHVEILSLGFCLNLISKLFKLSKLSDFTAICDKQPCSLRIDRHRFQTETFSVDSLTPKLRVSRLHFPIPKGSTGKVFLLEFLKSFLLKSLGNDLYASLTFDQLKVISIRVRLSNKILFEFIFILTTVNVNGILMARRLRSSTLSPISRTIVESNDRPCIIIKEIISADSSREFSGALY